MQIYTQIPEPQEWKNSTSYKIFNGFCSVIETIGKGIFWIIHPYIKFVQGKSKSPISIFILPMGVLAGSCGLCYGICESNAKNMLALLNNHNEITLNAIYSADSAISFREYISEYARDLSEDPLFKSLYSNIVNNFSMSNPLSNLNDIEMVSRYITIHIRGMIIASIVLFIAAVPIIDSFQDKSYSYKNLNIN